MEELKKKLLAQFGRYKYVLLVVAAGILLLLWPTSRGPDETPVPPPAQADVSFSVTETETRLAEALSSIQGVGRTRVVLTLKTDVEVLLSKDERESQHREMENGDLRSYQHESESKTVMKSGAEGGVPIVVGKVYPEFKGALVICEGAGDNTVQLRVVQAISALTGLGADKITVAAMIASSDQ